MVGVHADDGHGVLVQDSAVGLAKVAEAALGCLAEEFQNEFDNRRIIMKQTKQINQAENKSRKMSILFKKTEIVKTEK